MVPRKSFKVLILLDILTLLVYCFRSHIPRWSVVTHKYNIIHTVLDNSTPNLQIVTHKYNIIHTVLDNSTPNLQIVTHKYNIIHSMLDNSTPNLQIITHKYNIIHSMLGNSTCQMFVRKCEPFIIYSIKNVKMYIRQYITFKMKWTWRIGWGRVGHAAMSHRNILIETQVVSRALF